MSSLSEHKTKQKQVVMPEKKKSDFEKIGLLCLSLITLVRTCRSTMPVRAWRAVTGDLENFASFGSKSMRDEGAIKTGTTRRRNKREFSWVTTRCKVASWHA